MSGTAATTLSGTRGSHGVGALGARLRKLADGWAKHKGDPGAPNLDLIGDFDKLRSELESADTDAGAARAIAKGKTAKARATRTRVLVAYEKATLVVRAWLGPANVELEEFGITPDRRKGRKVPSRKRKAAAGAGGHGAPKPAEAAGSTTSSGSAEPTSASGASGASGSSAPTSGK